MPQQLANLNLPLQPERQVLYWFDPVGSHELFTPSRFPIFIWELEDGLQFYGFPFDKDDMQGGLKVGFFRLEDACTPDNIDRIVHDDEIARIRACVAQNMPAANGRLLDTATCMYTTTPDHHFILSAHPQHEQVIIASPCSGHGFKFGSVIGEILADLASERTTRHPVELFSVDRFSK
jgi:sarcosine oxidase